MIVYSVKGLFSNLKRVVKTRTSNRNKRVYDRIAKYRKIWFHYRSRWTDDNSQ
jgi:hypothetical protein